MLKAIRTWDERTHDEQLEALFGVGGHPKGTAPPDGVWTYEFRGRGGRWVGRTAAPMASRGTNSAAGGPGGWDARPPG